MKKGVGDSFSTIFECIHKCDGTDMKLFRRVTVNFNSHDIKHVRRDLFDGYIWVPITVAEIVMFFSIMLKISVFDTNWVATGPIGMMNCLYMHAQSTRLN